ncbi:alkaline shock response membrane anchor protein AmaP [Cetobacterium sp. SF1]|uniref:alkaline shock response membrane anchor protein AmaP n=1 Tax=unclassified Cetobacterium TaxID=2630983 RepID=UPI003CE967A6
MWKKIVFFFAWLGILVISILGAIHIISPGLLAIDTNTLTFKIITLNICILYFIITMLKFFSIFDKKEGYKVKNDEGTIYISQESIKSIVKDILNRDPEITGMKINSGKSGGKLFVSVTLEILSNENIAAKTTAIQSAIKNELNNKFDLHIDRVEVKISKVSVKREPML